MINQKFWHSSFWLRFRRTTLIKILGHLYRFFLTTRHALLSTLFRPYISFIAKNKITRKEPYSFGQLFVSLTTYPSRVNDTYYTICSILAQKVPANKILLTLTTEEFPNREKDLPQRILQLRNSGLEFIWTNINLKPHNKYFFSIQQYPNATIITVDDDIIYSRNVIGKLINSYQNNPHAISALCTDRYIVRGSKVLPYSEALHNDDSVIGVPQYDLAAAGFAGVLYPPSILPKETFNIANLKKCAPIADDIWLKFMELTADIPVVCAGKYKDPIVMPQVQKSALNKQNNIQNKNNIQQQAILMAYSSINFAKKIKI